MTSNTFLVVLVLAVLMGAASRGILAARASSSAAGPHVEDPSDLPVTPPLGLDLYIPAPPDNPITAAKVRLGRQLFADARLSADGRTSCESCHQSERAFTDGRRVSRGVFGRTGRRNVPSILNRAYGTAFSWDGRVATIEDQVSRAISGDRDLGLPVDVAAERVARDSTYAAAFNEVFAAPVSGDRLVQAIATFVRGSLSGGSPFDRFFAGDPTALSSAAQRGYALFTGRARCSRCHAGPLFTDDGLHNTGVGGNDRGQFEVTGLPQDRGRFKTPSLRNVVLTAPYMHNGSFATLESVVEFYNRGGRPNPNLDPAIRPLRLSAGERTDLVAFLRALEGEALTKPPPRPRAAATE